ncbi:aromatic amino acid transport family protein [Granulosicoccus antarcticus]|uniref:Serine transporter n=1 Tax=Granulosicoccus antarcticus IMCC3135 TaxID=1192854 RepID=A0A2Z2NUH7_9GAMM|nr:aromatic amino acid transport family protein [Granulosicoccus antarcticus]ASJ74903.1 Serine transporter [Granulosicoccus antarcticus IMCC3135]
MPDRITAVDEGTHHLTWSRSDTTWMLGLFGTAVGAGILFLPINAGIGGFWPLVIMAVLIFPMTYLSHRALARFVCSSSIPDSDITQVVVEHFGSGAGKAITLLYFMAIFPIVLIYGVGITNTVNSFMVNQLGMLEAPRWILSGLLVAAMMSVMMAGERIMLLVTQFLVYPLVAILIFISLYLVPSWNFAAISEVSAPVDILRTIWLTVPILVFSFNHSPAISQFAVALKRDHGDASAARAGLILRNTAIMLVGFVMLFVFSCVLALSPAQLAEAKAQNLPILSYLANVQNSPFISYFAPAVAFVAIVSSFFGHYMGASEGLRGIIRGQVDPHEKLIKPAALGPLITAFMFFTTWGVAVLNPSILGLIETLAGPVIAAILYLMPMYAIHKVQALKQYRGRLSNVFITFAGLVAMSGIVYGLLG